MKGSRVRFGKKTVYMSFISTVELLDQFNVKTELHNDVKCRNGKYL